MKNHKKIISVLLCCVVAAGLSGCNKQDVESEIDTIVGTYRLNQKPLYCEIEAVDPDAVALNIDGTKLTYANVNSLIMMGVGQVDNPHDIDITFNEDQTVSIVCDGVTIVPDSSIGIPADALSYQVVDGRIRLTVAEQLLQKLFDDEDLKYSDIIGADVALKLNYSFSDDQLLLYLDSNSLVEVLEIFQELVEHAGVINDKEQQVFSIIKTILPQLPNIIMHGYRKFDVGVLMKRLQ